jgi:hypothetical protein
MWNERILSKLSKHETVIERQLYRALHQLESAGKPPDAALPSRSPSSGSRGLGDARRGRR